MRRTNPTNGRCGCGVGASVEVLVNPKAIGVAERRRHSQEAGAKGEGSVLYAVSEVSLPPSDSRPCHNTAVE